MDQLIYFYLEDSDYFVQQLTLKDIDIFQKLYGQCTDFIELTYGHPPSPTIAREDFNDVPEGKTIEDLYILGLFNPDNRLIGIIKAVRYYPDNKTWWIGLMMLNPQHRKKGIGTKFYQAFEHWILKQDASTISLFVIKANQLGLQFWNRMGFEIIREIPPRQFDNKTHEGYVVSRILKPT
ncbi:MAG: GNAT family N-acetyltransferase [Microcoleaceae cyanobacterium]